MTSASTENREFYDRALPGRDDYWRKMAAPRARVEVLLRLVGEVASPGARVRAADLGSGGGQLLGEIHERYPNIELAGVDISSAQLAENARKLPFVAWYEVDLDAPGAAPEPLRGAFDVVIAAELIEHLDHPEVFLRRACELARPAAGVLLLSTQSGPLRETERRVGHRRHWSAREMDRALRESGWSPARIWNAGFPFHDLSKWYANRDPSGSMDRFAGKPYGAREDMICLLLRTAFRLNSSKHGAQLYAVARRADG